MTNTEQPTEGKLCSVLRIAGDLTGQELSSAHGHDHFKRTRWSLMQECVPFTFILDTSWLQNPCCFYSLLLSFVCFSARHRGIAPKKMSGYSAVSCLHHRRAEMAAINHCVISARRLICTLPLKRQNQMSMYLFSAKWALNAWVKCNHFPVTFIPFYIWWFPSIGWDYRHISSLLLHFLYIMSTEYWTTKWHPWTWNKITHSHGKRDTSRLRVYVCVVRLNMHITHWSPSAVSQLLDDVSHCKTAFLSKLRLHYCHHTLTRFAFTDLLFTATSPYTPTTSVLYVLTFHLCCWCKCWGKSIDPPTSRAFLFRGNIICSTSYGLDSWRAVAVAHAHFWRFSWCRCALLNT